MTAVLLRLPSDDLQLYLKEEYFIIITQEKSGRTSQIKWPDETEQKCDKISIFDLMILSWEECE